MTNRYLVLYGKCANQTGFTGHAPDVLGCYSEGETLEGMRAMLTEALTLHLEGTAEDGDPIPQPVTTKVDFGDDDFEGVQYFIVEHLEIPVPAVINPIQRIPRHEAIPA